MTKYALTYQAMNAKSSFLFVILAMASPLLSRVRSAEVDKDVLPPHLKNAPQFSLLQVPESKTVQIGTFVAFSVRAFPQQDATYQWFHQKSTNEAKIPVGEPNRRVFSIPAVREADVGAYCVRVTWPNVNRSVTTTNAFLSVYEVHGTNSAYGTLTQPNSSFGNLPAGDTNRCVSSSNPGWTFTKTQVPAAPSGSIYTFYGPGIPVSSQYGPFINSGRNKYLKIDTVDPLNAGSNTMVRLWFNFFNPDKLTEADCETGNSIILPIMEYYDMTSTTNIEQSRYRLSIYYNGTGPTSGNVVMHWLYFD